MRVDLAAQWLTDVFLAYLDEWEESVKGERVLTSQKILMMLSAETNYSPSSTSAEERLWIAHSSQQVSVEQINKFAISKDEYKGVLGKELTAKKLKEEFLSEDRYANGASDLFLLEQTGVGKSTLVNSILGKDVVKTGGPGCRSQSQPGPFSSLSAVTADITRASGDVEGVTVTVYDSPGLQDGHGKDESYLEKIREVFDQAHLTLYCFEMTTTRWLPPDQQAIELFTKRFGMEFWSKAILVLTKANQYQLSKPYADPAEWDKRCERAFLDIAEPIKEQLKKLLSPSEYSSVDNIPVGSGRGLWRGSKTS
eukprot:Em0001g1474a